MRLSKVISLAFIAATLSTASYSQELSEDLNSGLSDVLDVSATVRVDNYFKPDADADADGDYQHNARLKC